MWLRNVKINMSDMCTGDWHGDRLTRWLRGNKMNSSQDEQMTLEAHDDLGGTQFPAGNPNWLNQPSLTFSTAQGCPVSYAPDSGKSPNVCWCLGVHSLTRALLSQNIVRFRSGIVSHGQPAKLRKEGHRRPLHSSQSGRWSMCLSKLIHRQHSHSGAENSSPLPLEPIASDGWDPEVIGSSFCFGNPFMDTLTPANYTTPIPDPLAYLGEANFFNCRVFSYCILYDPYIV